MTWAKGGSRTSPLPPNWPTIRKTVLKAYGYQCAEIRGDTGRRCEAKATDVDHIGEDNDHSLNNLRALCSFHHLRKTGAQGGSRARQKQYTPRHPGIKP